MNLKQLKKQIGRTFRLHPVPHRIEGDGQTLPPSDDQWKFDRLLEAPFRAIRLVNMRTGHVIELGLDNIREYRSPGVLVLRCQLTISATGVEIEPIVGQ